MRLVHVGRHYRWLQHFVDRREALGIELRSLLGCGEIGCVFSIDRNRVLKVTLNQDEAGTWDVIAEEQRRNPEAMRGIATTFGRPFGISMPSVRKKILYGIVRENLSNVRQTDKLYDWLKPIEGPRFPGDPRPLKELDETVVHLPETRLMAASIHHLYLTTGGIYFLADIHTDNVGRRKGEKWLILRDPGWAETPSAGQEFDVWKPQDVVHLG